MILFYVRISIDLAIMVSSSKPCFRGSRFEPVVGGVICTKICSSPAEPIQVRVVGTLRGTLVLENRRFEVLTPRLLSIG